MCHILVPSSVAELEPEPNIYTWDFLEALNEVFEANDENFFFCLESESEQKDLKRLPQWDLLRN